MLTANHADFASFRALVPDAKTAFYRALRVQAHTARRGTRA